MEIYLVDVEALFVLMIMLIVGICIVRIWQAWSKRKKWN